jgi:trans-2,3-dihydro-3-hydroxyanthranilate isomerase
MPDYEYHTIDVFTSTRFGGNPLAVFPDARTMTTEVMQALSAEMNYSETTFVLPPDDPASDFRVRIFNRTSEMPFAGHPNVGTACVLARLGLAKQPVLRFEEISGLVHVRLTGDDKAEIDAPQTLSLMEELPADDIAACLSLSPSQIMTASHNPVRASVGVDFVLVEVRPDALATAVPDLAAFRRLAADLPGLGGRLSVFFYHLDGNDVRSRMFAPLAGTWEDPATGSANAALAALRLSHRNDAEIAYESVQGVEMGRRSELALRAWRTADGIKASVGGRCVPMFSGRISL